MVRFRQLLLLIWKNCVLQFRHPWVSLLELGIPAFFSFILVLVRSAITSDYVTKPTLYEPFSINDLPFNLTPVDGKQWHLLYTPNTTFFGGFMSKVGEDINVLPVGFKNEETLEEYYANYTGFTVAGIVFDDGLKNGIGNISNFKFTIRPQAAEAPSSLFDSSLKYWFTDNIFPFYPGLGPRNKDSTWGGNPGYMSKGFLSIQHAVSMNFLKVLVSDYKKNVNINILLCRYPYPPYLNDKFVPILSVFFPMVIVFSFLYPAMNIVKNIVLEKENKIKEAMKMMGLSKWLHWTAWYLKYFIFLSLSCCIITLLLCVKYSNGVAVVNHSDPFVILIWLIIYSSSFICFCFFLSTLFNKANSAAAGVGVICFVSFLPYFFIVPRFHQLSTGIKIFSCLLPNLALSIGSLVLTSAEATGNGLQWNSINSPPSPDTDITMVTIMFLFVIDGVIFLLLTWYIEAVFPGDYGVPEPWFFLFTYSYWFGHTSRLTDPEAYEIIDSKYDGKYELFPTKLRHGITIQNLTKVFAINSPALKNINIMMYEGHITALLGHNGAGKTTLISILTGLITPTSGSAFMNGYNIRKDMDNIHSVLGICPQQNILFNELTVEEHLYFFCKLKGYKHGSISSEVNNILKRLSLEIHRRTQAKYLSGGWKRKVSVGIALIGESKIAILDEPTSGMDVSSRRALWAALQKEKENRVILLTTHSMEEANVLGDRIAILADGEVQCCGSPLFLKRKYGVGYNLVMVKEKNCKVSPISKIILSHVPNAKEISNIGSELKYSLPRENSHHFCDLFKELDQRRNELKISSYGASFTTIEEVFMK